MRLARLFIRRLENEVLHFRGKLAELSDNNYRAVEAVDWIVVEKAIESSCVSEYARYRDILSDMIAAFRKHCRTTWIHREAAV